MTVAQLIEQLLKLPQGAEVRGIYDGSAHLNANLVYLARGGFVVIADFDEVVYDTEDRPHLAPTETEEEFWHTPPNPVPGDDA